MASGDIVKLNIGGKVFHTTRSTLTKYDGYFRAMFESGIPPILDESGCIFIDLSPKHFDLVLNFLRDGDTAVPETEFQKNQLLKEAEYYTLDGLIHLCGGEPSEEWKKANLDSKYVRAEIQYTPDKIHYNDYHTYCKDKSALLVNYSVSAWGDIHENLLVLNFVRKHSDTWNIFFYPPEDNCPKFIMCRPKETISCGTGLIFPSATCEKFLGEVEKIMEKHAPK